MKGILHASRTAVLQPFFVHLRMEANLRCTEGRHFLDENNLETIAHVHPLIRQEA